MTKTKTLTNSILLILTSILIGSLLIIVANYIPIRNSIKDISIMQLESEGSFPEVVSLQGDFGNFHSENPTSLELATDALILKMALYEGDGQGITQAFRCYSEQFEEEYSRYWHGYVVFLRVLSLAFNYYEIRIINAVCQTVLFMIVAYYIFRQKGLLHLLAFSSSYFLLMPLALMYCLQYSWIYYITFAAILCYIKFFQYWECNHRYIYLFMITGILAIYFDLWTYPLLTWGLLATWMILLCQESHALSYVQRVVISAISWLIGYGSMWMGKWLVGSLVLRENLWKRALEEIFVWTSQSPEASTTFLSRLKAIYLNLKTYSYKLYLIVLLLWFLYGIFSLLKGNIMRSKKTPALWLISLSSFVWYFLLADHVTMHHIFTHRIFVVSIASCLAILLVQTEKQTLPVMSIRKRLTIVGLLSVAGIISIILMFQIRDTYTKNNASLTFVPVPMTDSITMPFIPEHDLVQSIQLGLYTEDCTTGLYHIQLLDQSTVVQEEFLSVEQTLGGTFHTLDVNWHVKVGHPYTLEINADNTDGNIFLYLTENQLSGISEYGFVSNGSKSEQGQLLSGITYHCRLWETSKQVLFTLVLLANIMMLADVLWCYLATSE